MQITGLGYFGITSARIDEWHAFATDILGMESRPTAEGLRLRMDERDWRVNVRRADAEAFDYVGWEVADAPALRQAATELEAAGVPVKWADEELLRRRDVLGLLQLTDPDGVAVELFYGARTATTRFVSPTGVRFVTGEQGLGHVVFSVEDYAATLDFYTRLLGFTVSDYCDIARSRVAFLHTNPRHHSLAIGGIVVRPEDRPKKLPVDPGELFHFMVEVDDLDDVGRAYDRVLETDTPLALTLGRHSNDRMVSFYAITPSGFEVEFGTGAITVSDPWPATRIDTTSLWGHKRPARKP